MLGEETVSNRVRGRLWRMQSTLSPTPTVMRGNRAENRLRDWDGEKELTVLRDGVEQDGLEWGMTLRQDALNNRGRGWKR